MPATRQKPAELKTRESILHYLKTHGGTDSQTLAQELDLTPMAVRLHLYDLEKSDLVSFEEVRRTMGRPAKVWSLTADANRHFPDAHADLAADLLRDLSQSLGEREMGKFLDARKKRLIESYKKEINPKLSLEKQLGKLAEIRTREGYMAEVLPSKDGGYVFVENHCPICSAAKVCQGLCRIELEVFQKTLGGATIERSEHILGGKRRCAYRVSSRFVS
ncbi:MAG: transcriptional regulator [Spirochaetia bacterium]|nr:transcriptional regulator [Spirochaetia bacterium]